MDEDKNEKMRKYMAYAFIISFVSIITYLFLAAFEGFWPYSIIGYAPLYIQLTYPWGLYLLYWIAVIFLLIGLYYQDRSSEIIIFFFLIGLSIFIIILVGATIPPPA
ncbi:MAG: hypothetical protein ACTSPY_07745 [Candidatus Helarchaeota archaeon]